VPLHSHNLAAPQAPSAKPNSGARLAVLVLLLFLTAGAACAAWVIHQFASHKPAPMPLTDFQSGDEPILPAEKEAALKQMGELAAALMLFRDRMGGGMRFPDRLQDLREVELVRNDFSFIGSVSRRDIVYRPEIPPDQDPAYWVLAHDRLFGRRPNARGYGYSQGMLGAAVIFGDGKVRWLDEKEVLQFGGLSEPVAATFR
jgi:hypothetical protein